MKSEVLMDTGPDAKVLGLSCERERSGELGPVCVGPMMRRAAPNHVDCLRSTELPGCVSTITTSNDSRIEHSLEIDEILECTTSNTTSDGFARDASNMSSTVLI